jgi:hypothetical protein
VIAQVGIQYHSLYHRANAHELQMDKAEGRRLRWS